jgi:hypothetical protein
VKAKTNVNFGNFIFLKMLTCERKYSRWVQEGEDRKLGEEPA